MNVSDRALKKAMCVALRMDEKAWAAGVADFRREKDGFFLRGPHSPLGPSARAGFKGLSYYPATATYRFIAKLRREPEQHMEIPRSAGDTVTYRRVGSFTLPFPGAEGTLAAYETEGHGHGELFLMFRDATSGKETYGAGRYLEATPGDDDEYLVDFNFAYHPFCAYDDAFTCPLPPAENWLRVPIPAGERLP